MNKIIRIFSAPTAKGLGGALVGNASKRCNSGTVTLGKATGSCVSLVASKAGAGDPRSGMA